MTPTLVLSLKRRMRRQKKYLRASCRSNDEQVFFSLYAPARGVVRVSCSTTRHRTDGQDRHTPHTKKTRNKRLNPHAHSSTPSPGSSGRSSTPPAGPPSPGRPSGGPSGSKGQTAGASSGGGGGGGTGRPQWLRTYWARPRRTANAVHFPQRYTEPIAPLLSPGPLTSARTASALYLLYPSSRASVSAGVLNVC